MSIEKSASTGLHKTAANGSVHPSKNRAGGAGAAGEAPGGFASMLFALDTTLAEAPSGELATGADTASSALPGQLADATATGVAGAASAVAGAGAMALLMPAMPLSAQPAVEAAPASTVSLGTAPASRHGASALAGLSGLTAGQGAQAQPGALEASALSLQNLKPGKDGPSGEETIATEPARQTPAQHKTTDVGHASKALADGAHVGKNELPDTSTLAALEAMIKKMASSATATEGGLREGHAGSGESAGGIASQAGQGGWAMHSPSAEASPTYSPSAVADTGLLTPEAPVAEQMNYWVSRDVQNAQLRLEGFGADGVEVNITLQGKEAQVDFRTDMPEAREALEGASAQLKDMLSREGLVLAGVSVGTSAQGQGQTHAQQRRDQALARQARVTAAATANESNALQPLAVPQRASGRALDLFV